jgi:hypothetical protein
LDRGDPVQSPFWIEVLVAPLSEAPKHSSVDHRVVHVTALCGAQINDLAQASGSTLDGSVDGRYHGKTAPTLAVIQSCWL